MMLENESNIYSEVYCFINLLGKKYINRLPKALYRFFENNRNFEYYIKIDINKPIIEQFKFSETESIIEYLNLQYWCTQEEKEELIKQYKKNEIKYEEELKEKYNADNLFKKRQFQKKIETNDEKQLILKETLFERIRKHIIKIFHRFF